MKLDEFIKRIGDANAAELFGVSRRAAQSWRLGDRKPDQSNARTIVEATKKHRAGRVKYDDIYG